MEVGPGLATFVRRLQARSQTCSLVKSPPERLQSPRKACIGVGGRAADRSLQPGYEGPDAMPTTRLKTTLEAVKGGVKNFTIEKATTNIEGEVAGSRVLVYRYVHHLGCYSKCVF